MDHCHKIHIMFAGTRERIHQVKEDFLSYGMHIPTDEILAPIYIDKSIYKQLSPLLQDFPSIQIHFYLNVYELAKDLPKLDADLIIIDERVSSEKNLDPSLSSHNLASHFHNNFEQVLHVANQLKESDPLQQLCFENLKIAIDRFTPRDFNYTMRRVIVVLPQEARKSEREFILGLAQVRSVIVEPANAVDLFLYAVRGLVKFYQTHKKTSLCFSGGGVEGYLYSVGVAKALEDCFVDKCCYDFDIFCGVSSGAIISSSLAAHISPNSLEQQLKHHGSQLEHLNLNTIFDFATSEILRKSFRFFKAFTTKDLGEAIARFQDAIPIGFFRGEKLKLFIERQMAKVGVEDDISHLKKELYIGVTDQDTGEYTLIGEEPWRQVKISQAVRASAALPPFYLPERINGHWFSDGQITGGSGLIHAIHKGARLVVNVDPIVAFTSNMPGAVMKKGGYFTLLQSLKGIIQSRAASLLRHAMDKHPDVDFINFQPTDKVMEAMSGNPMKYQLHLEIVELGYQCSLAQILSNYDATSHKFAKHGFILKSKEEIIDFTQ